MKLIKTILVDDEPRGISSLYKLLQYHCPQVQVAGTAGNATEAKEKILLLKPQLVFLDIAMSQKSGFDLLNELPGKDFEVIFVTAHNQFMMQAFQFSAVDYLLKPVDDDMLKKAVERAAKRLDAEAGSLPIETLLQNIGQGAGLSQKLKLCISSLKGFQVVSIKDIVYLEASSNYTNFHFVNRSVICTSKPIHEYDELLSDINFLRIHKSYLVNLEHITEYVKGEGGSVILSNGHSAEVSRRKKEMLMARMKQYFRF